MRVLEVGVCGTDREISEGLFGARRTGDRLVIGHEMLGVVDARRPRVLARRARQRDGAPLVRPLPRVRRGRARLVPHRRLRRARHHAARRLRARARRRGSRAARRDPARARPPRRARGADVDLRARRAPCADDRRPTAVAAAARARDRRGRGRAALDAAPAAAGLRGHGPRRSSQSSPIVEALGARYVAGSHSRTRPFDLVVEAAGDAQLMADALGLLRRSGVACLLGIDGARAARSSSTAA